MDKEIITALYTTQLNLMMNLMAMTDRAKLVLEELEAHVHAASDEADES